MRMAFERDFNNNNMFAEWLMACLFIYWSVHR